MSPLNARMKSTSLSFRRSGVQSHTTLGNEEAIQSGAFTGDGAGLRFAKNALNASFASSDLTRSANTWFSNFTLF